MVDTDYIGYGATGRNAGKITPQNGRKYSDIYKRYGAENAKQYYEANKEALKLIEKIIDENNSVNSEKNLQLEKCFNQKYVDLETIPI